MSRFFANDSSDDSDSSNEELDKNEVLAAQAAVQGGKFAYESSESEEEKRVIRSEKDKRFDAMHRTIKDMKNHLKINDWASIDKDFKELNSQLLTAKTVVRKEGGIPRFFFKAIIQVEVALNSMLKSGASKKLNTSNSKAFNAMRQHLKKHNITYEKEIKKYLKNPLKSDEEGEDEDEEEEGEKEAAKPVAKPAAKAKKDSDQDDDEDAEEKGSEDDEEFKSDEESDSGSDVDVEAAVGGIMFTREFWMKKEYRKGYVAKPGEKKPKRVRGSDDEESESESEDDGFQKARPKKSRKNKGNVAKNKKEESEEPAPPPKEEKKEDFSPEAIAKRLKEIIAMRGKARTNKKQVIEDLKVLAQHATTGPVILKVQTTLCSALFDLSLAKGSVMMATDVWNQCHVCLMDIIKCLKSNQNVRLSEDADVAEAFDDDEVDFSLESLLGQEHEDEEESERAAEEKRKKAEERRAAAEAANKGIEYVSGNLFSFVQRMANEYMKALQNIDPHSPEYVTRLKDDKQLLKLVEATQGYYLDDLDMNDMACRVVLLRLSLIYYQYSPEGDALKAEHAKRAATADENAARAVAAAKKTPGRFGPSALLAPDGTLVWQLTSLLYAKADDKTKITALMYHVYNLALHNRYQEARNLLLMSHAQEQIHDFDIKTRILYNRCTAQLGLCAFRVGEFTDSLYCLADLYQSNRIRELIAQGTSMSRYHDRDPEKEKLERRRQYPYHMHMNLDMLESIHLVCAMFVEVPNLAVFGATNKRRVISKAFRRLFDHHQRQAFNGPPESTRDNIMAATKALRKGNWEKAYFHVQRLKMWSLFGQTTVSHSVKKLVERRVKEIGLRTYLLTYATQYTTVAIESLREMFQLTTDEVHKIVSKMMVNDNLQGAWDQPSGTIAMSAVQPSRLQKAALYYADKAALFVEQNERLLDQRSGWRAGGEGGWGDGHRGGSGGGFRGRGGRGRGGSRGRGGGGRGRY